MFTWRLPDRGTLATEPHTSSGLQVAWADDVLPSSGHRSLCDGGRREGIILGAAAYMSPEQARGKPVDKRTDIWAFGCVLYEMLTGRRPFPGTTTSDTVAAILEREVNWDALPVLTPEAIRRLLRSALEKETKARRRDSAALNASPGSPLSPDGQNLPWWPPWMGSLPCGSVRSTRSCHGRFRGPAMRPCHSGRRTVVRWRSMRTACSRSLPSRADWCGP